MPHDSSRPSATRSARIHSARRAAACAGVALVAALAAGATLPATAQSGQDPLTAQPVEGTGRVDRVVLYRGRAAVTRVVPATLEQGLWAVHVRGLPETVEGASIQAKVRRGATAPGATGATGATGAAPSILSVEYAESPAAGFAGTPEGVALANELRDLRRAAENLKQDMAGVAQQVKIVEQISLRPTAAPREDGATQRLDLAAIERGLAFVATERRALLQRERELARASEELARTIEAKQRDLDARGGAQRTERTAIVVVAAPERAPIELEVTYNVTNATWEPVYTIRAAGDRSGVEIECDAMVAQSTGEDWRGVRMALSTAQPTRASAPPAIQPWFIDQYVPPPPPPPMPMAVESAAPGAPAAMSAPAERKAGAPGRRRAEIEALADAASVQEAGVAVAYELPRTLDVPSDRAKKQRTRIATVAPSVEFVYTAQPLVTEDVFLRGDMVNTSPFQFLPGRAQVFMGGEFIGETRVPSVAPKDQFRVFFGPDRALRARRELVAKTTGSTGFLGGSQTTTWSYRVLLENSTPRDARVELLDRRPVSRNEKIVAAVSKLSRPLSTVKEYVEGPMTQGILRWDLTVPANTRGDGAMQVLWTAEVSRANNVETTPLPES
jgi:uncharacterized protein (TIGR02231 family)